MKWICEYCATRGPTRSARTGFSGSVAIACLAFVSAGLCGCSEPVTSWQSPRLIEVQKQWEAIARIGTQDKSVYEERERQCRKILQGTLSAEDLRRLTETCGNLPRAAKDRSRFANAVLANAVETFVTAGDRDNLVKLLSTRCPVHIGGPEDIEFWLAFRGERLQSPLLVLGDAFDRCQVPEVRHDLAGVVRRAFAGHKIEGKDDAEYVANAMQWYRSEANHLSVNPMYADDPLACPAELYDVDPKLHERLLSSPRHCPLLLENPTQQ